MGDGAGSTGTRAEQISVSLMPLPCGVRLVAWSTTCLKRRSSERVCSLPKATGLIGLNSVVGTGACITQSLLTLGYWTC